MSIDPTEVRAQMKAKATPEMKSIYVQFFTACLENDWTSWEEVPQEVKDEMNHRLSKVMAKSIQEIVSDIVSKEVTRILDETEALDGDTSQLPG